MRAKIVSAPSQRIPTVTEQPNSRATSGQKNMVDPVMSRRRSSLKDAKSTTAKRPNTRNVRPRKGTEGDNNLPASISGTERPHPKAKAPSSARGFEILNGVRQTLTIINAAVELSRNFGIE
jgi:hypothetical protein